MFQGLENKYDVYKDEDCTKEFCASLREHAIRKIGFEKYENIPLTSEEYESYLYQKSCHICKKKSKINTLLVKIIVNLGIIVIIQVNTEVLHIVHVIYNMVYLKKFL